MLDLMTIVWGEMIESYLEMVLPSLLQPGNIPATKDQIHTYMFYASDEAKHTITHHQKYKHLDTLVNIHWTPLIKGEWETTSNIQHQMELSAKAKCYIMIAIPDAVVGNGSLFNLAKLADGTKNPIQYSFPRVTEAGFQKLMTLFKETPIVTNRDLVTLGMTYITKANYPIKQIAGGKWAVNHEAPNPCILPDSRVIEMFAPNDTANSGWDHMLPYLMMEAGYPYYIIPHSDIFFQVERGEHLITKGANTSYKWRRDKFPASIAFYRHKVEAQIWQGNFHQN